MECARANNLRPHGEVVAPHLQCSTGRGLIASKQGYRAFLCKHRERSLCGEGLGTHISNSWQARIRTRVSYTACNNPRADEAIAAAAGFRIQLRKDFVRVMPSSWGLGFLGMSAKSPPYLILWISVCYTALCSGLRFCGEFYF